MYKIKTMKKIAYLTLIFAFTLSIVSYSNQTNKLPKNAKKTIKSFQKAVKKHEQEKVMKLLDANYVKEQHDQFLEGRTEQFLEELFCGNSLTNQGKFECHKFTNISSIKLISYDEKENGFKLHFKVTSEKTASEVILFLVKNESNYFILGAVG